MSSNGIKAAPRQLAIALSADTIDRLLAMSKQFGTSPDSLLDSLILNADQSRPIRPRSGNSRRKGGAK